MDEKTNELQEKIDSADAILVGRSGNILIVARKLKGEALTIINAFDGEEAEEIYNRLITPKN